MNPELPSSFTQSNSSPAFDPTITDCNGETHRAWLELEDDRAHLVCDGTVVRSSVRPLSRPVLFSDDERAYLAWSEETEDGTWPLLIATVEGDAVDDVRVTDGSWRPVDVTVCQDGDGHLLAWEATRKTDSEIHGVRVADGEAGAVERLSAPTVQAYDAAVAADNQRAFLLYTALRDGWVEVEGRIREAGSWSEPTVLSKLPCPAGYPTVLADGDGAWVGWVNYRSGFRDEQLYVTHERSLDQHSFFYEDRTVSVFHWDGDALRAPEYDTDWRYASAEKKLSGEVFIAEGGTRPRLLADSDGTLWLAWLDYDDSSRRPRVAASHLKSDRWSDPVTADFRYGDAQRLHIVDAEGRPLVATGRDTRDTGWGGAEFADETDDCAIGHLRLPTVDPPEWPRLRSMNHWVHTRRDLRAPRVEAEDDDGRTLVFFNYHQHSDLSVCARQNDGEPDLNIRLSRDVMGQRSTALTDHCYNSDALARYRTERTMRRYHSPGTFVTVPSYEWTGSNSWNGEHYGHFNVHWFEEGMPPLGTPTVEGSPLSTPTELWDRLADEQALTIPHHTANEEHYLRPDLFDEPAFAPVVEVFQDIRGTCETHEGPGATRYADVNDRRCYVQSQLADGVRLGFIGGGDHFGVAMTGVWVDELTRAGIYEALCDRRCFATTGTALALSTRIENVPMGGTIETDDDRVEFTLDLSAPDGVQTVEVLCDNQIIHELDIDGDEFAGSVTVPLPAGDEHWIYPRILLENGEVAWGSPIWVEIPV